MKVSSNNNIYNLRAGGGQHGDVFTHPRAVNYMLDLVGYTADKNLSAISIMEPSCGEGEFLVEIVRRLYESAVTFGFDVNDAYHRNVYAADIDVNKIKICVERILKVCPLISNVLDNISVEDFLLSNHSNVDIVVGNPPYIRYEQIPKDKLDAYKVSFSAFYYRSDMYILFFEKTLRMLNQGGKHCFICSNRWMRNTYGKLLRRMVASQYHIEKIINMERANAFQEDVLAYPAVTLFSNSSRLANIDYAEISDVDELDSLTTRQLYHPTDENWSMIFVSDNDCSMLSLIEEQGFNIGIGVATGADSVYVSSELKDKVEEELLIPTINAKNLKGNEMKWDGRYLINPYTSCGTLIKLDSYPKAKMYFESHRERLVARHKAKKNPVQWYATLDPINQCLQKQAKVLLPDISGNTYVFVDEGKYYPQHNIYYITGGTLEELQLIAAMLMSENVRNQLGNLTNRMNGGYARWQSQYLRLLRVPSLKNIPIELKKGILSSYKANNISGINNYMDKIVANEKKNPIAHVKKTSVQMQLNFDFA